MKVHEQKDNSKKIIKEYKRHICKLKTNKGTNNVKNKTKQNI